MAPPSKTLVCGCGEWGELCGQRLPISHWFQVIPIPLSPSCPRLARMGEKAWVSDRLSSPNCGLGAAGVVAKACVGLLCVSVCWGGGSNGSEGM